MSVGRHHGHHGHHNSLHQLAVGIGAHYAGRATDEAYEYGKRKVGEFMHNAIHKKQKNGRHYLSEAQAKYHAKHASTKAKTEHPVIDSMELQASGVEHESYSFHNKLPKKAKLLSALSRPVIHREIVGYTSFADTGECKFAELAPATRAFIQARVDEALLQATTGTVAQSLVNTQVLYKSVKFKRTITNTHNEPIYVMWHEWMAKVSQAVLPSNIASVQSGQEGATSSAALGSGTFFPDTDLRVYSDVRRNWRLLHRRRVYLKPGETIVYYSNYTMNKMMTHEFIAADQNTAYIANWTPCATFQIQGASACTVTATGNATLSRAKIDIVESITSDFVPYPLPAAKLNRFDSTNNLPTQIAVGATIHPNVDTAVIGADADA
jgi:hypothetical protein